MPEAEPESHQRLERVLEQALERPSAERDRYVEEACGDDAALCEEVKRLLRRGEEVVAFMSDPTVDEGSNQADALVGSEIGPYKVLQRLGEGGHGVVYLAEQRRPVTRRVALKVIKLGMDTKQVIARFEAERQALAMMEHANIARVFDAGTTDVGRPYFVMELVRGVPVTEYCRENQLDTRGRLRLFAQICRAVHHAHQKGVIHRDLKPSNILITLHDGVPVPKIIDFGIAKATNALLTEKTLFTEFQQFVGTPAYTSPEQVEMSGLDVDTRSDIYSLGVLLYELLTGTTPIESETLKKAAYAEIQRAILETNPPKPSTRLTELRKRAATGTKLLSPTSALERELDWIAMKALEKDRRRRYESASTLAEDVERFLVNEPVMAVAPSLLYLGSKFIQRHRTAALLAIAVAASLLAGLIATTIAYSWERRARTELAEREQRLLDASYAHDVQAVAVAFRKGHATIAQEILLRHVPAPGELDRREWLWRFWMGRLHQEAATATDTLAADAIAASPDGQWLALFGENQTQILTSSRLEVVMTLPVASRWPHGGSFSGDSRYLHVWNEELTTIDLASFQTQPAIPAFKPEGGRFFPTPDRRWMITVEWVATAPGKPKALRLSCVDPAREPPLVIASSDPITPPHRFMLGSYIRVSPNSRQITMSAIDHSMRVLSIPDMEEVARIPLQEHANTTAWSPDSTKLAIGFDFPQEVQIWDVPSKRRAGVLDALEVGPKSCLAFSLDGRRIAASHMEGAILVWDVATGDLIDQFLTETLRAIAFLPDGSLVSTGEGPLKRWEIGRGRHQTELEKLSRTHTFWNLAYSPDRAILATTASDGVVRLFDGESYGLVHAFPSVRAPDGHRPPYGGAPLAFSPDSRTLVAANGDHTVSVLDMVARKERLHLDGHTGAIANLAISADGDLLATTGEDRTMVVWHLATGEERERIPSPGPKWIDFSPELGSHLLAYRDRDGVGLLNLRTPEKRYHETRENVWVMKFTPEGDQVIVGINGAQSWLFDTATFQQVGSLPPLAGAVKPNYSPDERNLVIPSWGHGSQIWHMDAGISLGSVPLPEESNWVYAAVFAPDGRTLLVSTRGRGVLKLTAPSLKE